MKYLTVLNVITSIALSAFALSASANVPSNSLQVEYTKKSLQQSEDTRLFDMDSFYHIPIATYHCLDNIFTSFYNKVTFKTAIADSTFQNSEHYELVSIPLIAENEQGLQIEFFGSFSDLATQHLSNISSDQALYEYYSNTAQWDLYDSSFTIGAGISFNTSEQSKIKLLISSNEMPGYGTSNALVGFESKF